MMRNKFFLLALALIFSMSFVQSAPITWTNVLNYGFEFGEDNWLSCAGNANGGGSVTECVFETDRWDVDTNSRWQGSYLLENSSGGNADCLYNQSLDDANVIRLYYDYVHESLGYSLSVRCADAITGTATISTNLSGANGFIADNQNDGNFLVYSTAGTSQSIDCGSGYVVLCGADFGKTMQLDAVQYKPPMHEPSIVVTQPDGINDYLTGDTGYSYNVRWIASDEDYGQTSTLDINCYIEPDGNYLSMGTDLPCFTNTNNDGVQACDFTDMNTDNYYIWCSAMDDDNKTATDYSNGYIQLCEVGECAGDLIDFNGITNVASDTWEYQQVNIDPTVEGSDMIYSLTSNSGDTITLDMVLLNSIDDGSQYFIYTANKQQYDLGQWVFNDGLTFGTASTYDDPIQKVYDENASQYEYTFDDTIYPNQVKYYKVVLAKPAKFWRHLTGDDEWFNRLEGYVSEIDDQTWEQFSVSAYNDMYSILKEYLPELISSSNVNFEFQFNAYAESPTEIQVGTYQQGDETTNTISLTTTEKRFSIPINSPDWNAQLLITSSASDFNHIYFADYALVTRGYFTERLEVTKPNRNELDVILLTNVAYQYIREAEKFRASTSAYDREGRLQKLEVIAYFDTNASGNTVKKYVTDLNSENENTFDFDEVYEGIIDLSGTATSPDPPRDIILEAKLYDGNGMEVATQSKTFKFIQYPYFPDDLRVELYSLNKNVGDHPLQDIFIRTRVPERVIGIDYYIYDGNHSTSDPNYYTRLYKDDDFTCLFNECNFRLNIDDWVFEDKNRTTVHINVLLNTENPSTTNHLTNAKDSIYIGYLDFEILRIFQTVERNDLTYRNDEEIQLVMQVKDSLGQNLINELDAYLTLSDCNTSSGDKCTAQTTDFYPASHLFDPINRTNMWFFRDIYYKDTGDLWEDGNYMRVVGTVSDKSGRYETATHRPVLTRKCQAYPTDIDYNVSSFLSLVGLGWLYDESNYVFGCSTAQNGKVTTTENTAEETRLLIDVDHSLSSPTYEGLFCWNADQNNLFMDELEQKILCGAWYTIGESPVDKFDFTIGNKNSDYSIKDSETKQYLEIGIPYELVLYNDVGFMQKALETNQDTTINSVGDFFYYGFNEVFNWFGNFFVDVDEFTGGKYLRTNTGYDVNFSKTFSPENITGAFIIEITGLEPYNVYDYGRWDNVMDINPENFLEYVNYYNKSLREKTTTVKVYLNDFSNPAVYEIPTHLVIKENPDELTINRANLTADQQDQIKEETLPINLSFDISSNLVYNSNRDIITRHVLLNTTAIIGNKDLISSVTDFIDDLFENPVDAIGGYLMTNAWWILALLIALIMVSIVYANFKGGGITVLGNFKEQ